MSRNALLDELINEALANQTRPLGRKRTVALFTAPQPREVHLFGQRATFVFPRIWSIITQFNPKYTKRNRDIAASFLYGAEFILEYREMMNRWAVYAPHRPDGFKSFENNEDAESHLILFMGVTLTPSGKLGASYGEH